MSDGLRHPCSCMGPPFPRWGVAPAEVMTAKPSRIVAHTGHRVRVPLHTPVANGRCHRAWQTREVTEHDNENHEPQTQQEVNAGLMELCTE